MMSLSETKELYCTEERTSSFSTKMTSPAKRGMASSPTTREKEEVMHGLEVKLYYSLNSREEKNADLPLQVFNPPESLHFAFLSEVGWLKSFDI